MTLVEDVPQSPFTADDLTHNFIDLNVSSLSLAPTASGPNDGDDIAQSLFDNEHGGDNNDSLLEQPSSETTTTSLSEGRHKQLDAGGSALDTGGGVEDSPGGMGESRLREGDGSVRGLGLESPSLRNGTASPGLSGLSFMSQTKDLSKWKFDHLDERFDESFAFPGGGAITPGRLGTDSPRRRLSDGNLILGTNSGLGGEDGYGGLGLKQKEKLVDELKKENFNLKMRIYYLQEQIQKNTPEGISELMNENADFKVHVENLEAELADYHNSYEELQMQHEELEAKSTSIVSLVEKLKAENATLQSQVSELHSVHAKSVKDLVERLELAKGAVETRDEDVGRLQNEVDELQRAMEDSRERVESLEKENREVEETLQAVQREGIAAREEFHKKLGEITKDRDDALEETEQQIAQIQMERDGFSEEVNELRQQVEKLRRESEQSQSLLDQAREENRSLTNTSNALVRERDSAAAENAKLVEELAALSTTTADDKSKQTSLIIKLKKEAKELGSQMLKTQSSLDASQNEVKSLTKALEEATAKKQSQSAEVRLLEREAKELKKELSAAQSKLKDSEASKSRKTEESLDKVRAELEREWQARMAKEVDRVRVSEAGERQKDLEEATMRLRECLDRETELKIQLEGRERECERLKKETLESSGLETGEAEEGMRRSPSALWQEISELRAQIESTNLENEKLRKEVESAQLLIQKAGHLEAQHIDESLKVQEDTQSLRKKLTQKDDEVIQLTSELQKLKKNLRPSLDASYTSQILKERRAFQEKEESFRERLSESDRAVSSLRDDLEREQRESAKWKKDCKHFQNVVTQLESKLADMAQELECMRIALVDRDENVKDLIASREEVEKLQSVLDEKESAVEEMKATIQEMTSVVDAVRGVAGDERVEEACAPLREQITELKNRLADEKADKEQLLKDFDAQQENHQQAMQNFAKEKEKYRAASADQKEHNQFLAGEVERLTAEVQNVHRRWDDDVMKYTEAVDKLQDDLERVTRDKYKAEKDLAKLQHALKAKEEECNGFRQEVEMLRTGLEERDKEVEGMRKASSRAEENVLKLKPSLAAKDTELDGVRRELERVEGQLLEKERQCDELRRRATKNTETVGRLEHELRNREVEMERVQQDFEDLRDQVLRQEKALEELKKQRAKVCSDETLACHEDYASRLMEMLVVQAADTIEQLTTNTETKTAELITVQQTLSSLQITSKETETQMHAKINFLEAALKKKDAHIRTLTTQFDDQLANLTQSADQSIAAETVVVEQMKGQITHYKQQIADLRRMSEITREEFDIVRREGEEKSRRLLEVEERVKQLDEERGHLAMEVTRLQAEIARLERRCRDGEERAKTEDEDAVRRTKELEAEISRARRLLELKGEEVRREIDAREEAWQDLERHQREAGQFKDDIRQELKKQGIVIDEYRRKWEDAAAELERFKDFDRKIGALQVSKTKTEEKVMQLQTQLQEKSTTIITLESDLSKLQRTLSQNDSQSLNQKQVFLKQMRERDALIRMRDGLLVGVAQYLGKVLQQKVVRGDETFSDLKERIVEMLKGVKGMRDGFEERVKGVEREIDEKKREWEQNLAKKSSRLAKCEEIGRVALRLKQQLERNVVKARELQQRLVEAEEDKLALQEQLMVAEKRIREVAGGARGGEGVRKALEERILELEEEVRDAEERALGERRGAEERVEELVGEKRMLEKQVDAAQAKLGHLEEWRRTHPALSTTSTTEVQRKLMRINEQLRRDLDDKIREADSLGAQAQRNQGEITRLTAMISKLKKALIQRDHNQHSRFNLFQQAANQVRKANSPNHSRRESLSLSVTSGSDVRREIRRSSSVAAVANGVADREKVDGGGASRRVVSETGSPVWEGHEENVVARREREGTRWKRVGDGPR
ncbi:hypothetical protein HK097_008565 [Rhizophlyctis rosea]|uniref:Centrosomin N-terminal motif 1 domain-containing protein n=1 Tax=Rhizophlyctis rosea TaxID=64517 RepID=A0AAD5X104_9FUNG|nr:hypothetical protein HK097_008565 [Rhizophlyctis rosea]